MSISGRLAQIVLLTGGLLLPRGLEAQETATPAGWTSGGATVHSHSYGPGAHGSKMQEGLWQGGATSPAPFGPPPHRVGRAQLRSSVRPGHSYYASDGTITRPHLEEPNWDPHGPLERFLGNVVTNTWLQVDYQVWQLDDPSGLLGAPLSTLDDSSEPFPVFDFQDPPNQIGTARVPTLNDANLDNIDGVRFTYGVPLTFGDFEAYAFIVEQASERQTGPREPGFVPPQDPTDPMSPDDTALTNPDVPVDFFATSTRINGDPSNNVQLYTSFESRFESDIWGAGGKVVWDSLFASQVIKVRPLLGFQYVNVDERLTIDGEFDDGVQPVVRTTIDSDTGNHVFGPSTGVEAQVVTPWATLDVEPKFVWGIGRMDASVFTNNFRSNDDPPVLTTGDATKFSPTFDLSISLRVPVSEMLSVHVGYDLLFISRVTRPHENIFYNDRGALPTPPDVVLDMDTTDLFMQAFSVGGVLRFP